MDQWEYRQKKHPALIYILRGFLPGTRENLLLSFKPGLFFAEMERKTGYKRTTLQTTYYRARQSGFIDKSLVPQLTSKGLSHIRPYVAQKLDKEARLLLIFDIPQTKSKQRNAFRRLLKNLGFRMVQQSVWMSGYDHRETIQEAISALKLDNCVEIYESIRIA